MNNNPSIRNKEYWSYLISVLLITIFLILIFNYGRQAKAFYEQLPVKLTIYTFSTQGEVISEGILPEFKKRWEAESGQEIEVEAVSGPSATLAGEINLGAPADIAILSNAHHVNWLKMGRKVKMDTQPIVIGQTPMVIVTRPGNPYNIRSYADLAQSGLCLLHADPHTSGGGEWAILSEYGSAFRETGSPSDARAQVQGIWNNVSILGTSARATMELFNLGIGDALITYEQDALMAKENGIPLEIIYPPRTILAEHVVIVVDDNIILRERNAVQAFMEYVVSESAQQTFSSYHLRPANMVSNEFPFILDPFTVEELGGWSFAYSDLVEEYWQDEIKPRLDLTPTSVIIDTED